jgi:hypothetical protein
MVWEEVLKFAGKFSDPGQLKSLLLLLSIAVPLYLLFNLSGVLESVYSFRKRKQSVIKDYFDKDMPRDTQTEKAILDAREARYFKYVLGIYAEEKFRHALIRLHDKLSPSVDWRNIRRAMRYLSVRDGEAEVFIDLVAIISYLLYLLCYFLVSYILLILGQQFVSQPLTFVQQPNKIAYSLVYSLLFWVLLSEIWKINSAAKIWSKLNDGKSKSDLVRLALKRSFTKKRLLSNSIPSASEGPKS